MRCRTEAGQEALIQAQLSLFIFSQATPAATLPVIDWSVQPRMPFTRAFLPLPIHENETADVWRQGLGISIEDKGALHILHLGSVAGPKPVSGPVQWPLSRHRVKV